MGIAYKIKENVEIKEEVKNLVIAECKRIGEEYRDQEIELHVGNNKNVEAYCLLWESIGADVDCYDSEGVLVDVTHLYDFESVVEQYDDSGMWSEYEDL